MESIRYNKSDKPVVIIGGGEHGQMMHHFFIQNTDIVVCGFAVERKYNRGVNIEGLPVVDFEDIVSFFPPSHFNVFVAVTFVKMNKERTRLYHIAKALGYGFVSYVDPSSTVDDTAIIGENVAIFENNVIQYHSVVEANTVMQAGGVLAHRSTIRENVWVAPSCAIAGMSEIGSNCFLGINSTIGNEVIVPEHTIIGAGAVVYKSLDKTGVYVGNPCRMISNSSEGYF